MEANLFSTESLDFSPVLAVMCEKQNLTSLFKYRCANKV